MTAVLLDSFLNKHQHHEATWPPTLSQELCPINRKLKSCFLIGVFHLFSVFYVKLHLVFLIRHIGGRSSHQKLKEALIL